jgi:hypothetical protein
MTNPKRSEPGGYLWLMHGPNDPHPRRLAIHDMREFMGFSDRMQLLLTGRDFTRPYIPGEHPCPSTSPRFPVQVYVVAAGRVGRP